jgi:hypothetical protein
VTEFAPHVREEAAPMRGFALQAMRNRADDILCLLATEAFDEC